MATRNFTLDVDAFQDLDKRRRQCVTESEQLKAERNQATAEIGKLRKEGVDTAEKQQAVRAMAERMTDLDAQVTKLDEEFRDVLSRVPNLTQESVPVGKSEHDNVEVRKWGKPTEFTFKPKPHWDLGPELGILDMERAATEIVNVVNENSNGKSA